MKTQKHFLPNIALCLMMYLIGMSTYIFPAFGEFGDILWAPLSAFIFLKMFGGRIGAVGSVLNFIEEIVPFTDIIPSFTIAWFIRKREIEKSAFRSIRG